LIFVLLFIPYYWNILKNMHNFLHSFCWVTNWLSACFYFHLCWWFLFEDSAFSCRSVSLASKWVILTPNGTNPWVFQIRFQYILAQLKWCTENWYVPLWSQTWPSLHIASPAIWDPKFAFSLNANVYLCWCWKDQK